MCLLLFAYRSHPHYPIVLAANRDEFHTRPAAAAGFWDDDPRILAGRDLQAGGTWLGISKEGRIAAVTNYHEAAINQTLLSRGVLVSDYLRREITPRSYADIIADNGKWYGGFNVVFGTKDDLFYCTNRRNGYERLEPGIHGLSNRLLNDGSFKVRKGREGLNSLLSQRERIVIDELFSLLDDREQSPDEELSPQVGTVEEERFYSSMFIKGEQYGTRSSTIIIIDRKGIVQFAERTFSPEGARAVTVEYEFQVA